MDTSTNRFGFKRELDKEVELSHAMAVVRLHNKSEGDIPLRAVDASLKVLMNHVKFLSGWKGRMKMRRRNDTCELISKKVDRLMGHTDDLVFALQQIADNSQGVLPDEVNCSDDDDSGGNGGDWDATKFMEKMYEVQRDKSAKEAHRHQSQRGMKIDNDAGSTKGASFVNLNIEPKACLS
ncbi:hypothetical protein ElyMa_002267600 [Elysia marginata]|uniref:Uncharacterized protein n=1 Tax=Elysia marginata TaxID=1093978 RepID=A0AAV4G0C4_9GAST|nr:hypothetical protein ElyMa_002267600 [Elysia marginata]